MKNGTTKLRWTDQETQQLKDAVCMYGARNWRYIATFVPTRNAKQCRERWNVFLDPEFSRDKWTDEEDQILRDYQSRYGNRWADIAKYLPGRSCVSIRNRWACLMRRGDKVPARQQLTNVSDSTGIVTAQEQVDIFDQIFCSVLTDNQLLAMLEN